MENTNAISPEASMDDSRLSEVRRRRVYAFCVDYLVIALLSIVAGVFVFFLGILTLGLAWLIYGAIIPIVAIAYFGLTMAGDEQASVGMRMFSIKVERLDGGRVDFLMATLHTILFWVGNMILPVLILFVSLFSSRKRLVQDILLGTVFVRSDL